MKKTKFEKEFRDAFLGDVRPPEGSFKYFEDKLRLERKEPFHKRRPILLNTIVVSVFIVVMLLSNILVYSFAIKDRFRIGNLNNEIIMMNSKELDITSVYELFSTELGEERISLFILNSDFSDYIYFNKLQNDNYDVNVYIDDELSNFNLYKISKSKIFNNDFYYYLSNEIKKDKYDLKIIIVDKSNNNELVNFSTKISF